MQSVQKFGYLSVFMLGQILSQHGYDGLVICTWNIFRFGPGKFSVPDVLIAAGKAASRMDIIVDQLQFCDIAAIQEYMDVKQTVMETLRLELVRRTGFPFSMDLSPRVGRNRTEQYAFLYRSDKVSKTDSAVYPEVPNKDEFHREPYFVRFATLDSKNYQMQDILLGTVHLDPEEAVDEINSLVGVFNWGLKHFSTQDLMILGDYNAGCSYVKERDWPRIKLWTNKTFTWIVPHDMDTTAMASVCPYTRAVYVGQAFKNSYMAGSVESPDFAQKFNLTSAEARLVSDHRLVKMTFSDSDSNKSKVNMDFRNHASAISLDLLPFLLFSAVTCKLWI